jgi:ketosteroid isomerase-like protein
MAQPVVTSLEKFYSDLIGGDQTAAASSLPENVTFAVAGKSLLAGKYTKATFFSEYITKLKELSGGKLNLEVHDVLGGDRHATVLLTHTVDRKGVNSQIRAVHVWRVENGKPIAGYEYPRDMYQYDSIWS